MVWISFAILTALVLAIVLRPLARSLSGPTDDQTLDIAVYRDQLDEVKAESERGVLPKAEAEQARTEIARRLLNAARRQKAEDEQVSSPARSGPIRTLHLAVLAAFVPAVAIPLYLLQGRPDLPALPHAARMTAPPDRQRIGDLIARVEERLRRHPEDGQGWNVLAPVYMRLERYREAADAYARALRLLGENADRLSGFALATILANNGIVSEDARVALTKARLGEPGRIDVRFWLAVAREQDGDLAGALSELHALLASAPADAPWRPAVDERIRAITARLAAAPASPGKPAPTKPAPPAAAPATAPKLDRQDMDAAAKMSPAERARMIEGMVDRLATRLRADGKDVDGWLRLIRAYMVLGRKDRATAALADGRKALAGDTSALGKLDALAKSLGLGS